MNEIIAIFLGVFISSFISTVAGLGAALLILPLFVQYLGAKSTVVALTMCMIWGNANKVFFFRKHVDKKVVLMVILGGIPAAVIGASFLPGANALILKRMMGFLIIIFIITRLFQPRIHWKVKLTHFPFIGMITGLISGLVGAAGPVIAPFFINYGLLKERFNGTNSVAALVFHVVKIFVFQQAHMITAPILMVVSISLTAITAGTVTGKIALSHLSTRTFEILLLNVLGIIAIQFLFFS